MAQFGGPKLVKQLRFNTEAKDKLTSAPALPGTSELARGTRGSTLDLLFPEHFRSYGSKPGCLWWLF